MLDGITVLSEQTVTESCFWWVLLIFISVGVIGCIVIDILTHKHNIIKQMILYNLGIIGCMFVLGLLFACIVDTPYKEKHTYTEYKVTIDSTVNFLDFEEKYIITNKEGQIYTIVDRGEYE